MNFDSSFKNILNLMNNHKKFEEFFVGDGRFPVGQTAGSDREFPRVAPSRTFL